MSSKSIFGFKFLAKNSIQQSYLILGYSNFEKNMKIGGRP
jgi:hypothetical protein